MVSEKANKQFNGDMMMQLCNNEKAYLDYKKRIIRFPPADNQ
jgi:hypothetical protein